MLSGHMSVSGAEPLSGQTKNQQNFKKVLGAAMYKNGKCNMKQLEVDYLLYFILRFDEGVICTYYL